MYLRVIERERGVRESEIVCVRMDVHEKECVCFCERERECVCV